MQQYARYEDIDKDELEKDIENIKKTIGAPNQEDFQHLLRMEKWGKFLTFGGYAMIALISIVEVSYGISAFAFWEGAIIAAIMIGVGNVARWANVTHPILHGAYDKVEGVPKEYTKNGYAKGWRRYIDWLDWIKPEAWEYEHNIMHHYHLGEKDDPDNIENNMTWLTESNVPMFLRYMFVYIFAATWKLTYYAPNTLKILENKERRQKKLPEIDNYDWSFTTKRGKRMWKEAILPYLVVNFIIVPSLFIVISPEAVFNAFIITVMAELVANLHSFLVIVPNHSAEDIYQFEEPHKSQGEFYLRQIMGSVNYNTGSDTVDFLHGWLNYQVEHHLFPNLPLSQYQKMQPIVKEVCRKHNLEYRQESVFKRFLMTVELMVGNAKLLRVKGI